MTSDVKVNNEFVGSVLVGLVIFVVVMTLIWWGIHASHDAQITHRHRIEACRMIETESIRTFCLERS